MKRVVLLVWGLGLVVSPMLSQWADTPGGPMGESYEYTPYCAFQIVEPDASCPASLFGLTNFYHTISSGSRLYYRQIYFYDANGKKAFTLLLPVQASKKIKTFIT